MINEKIDLYEYFGLPRGNANGGYLTVHARTESGEMPRRSRPAMLVIPGGAYSVLSDREGEPVALKFIDRGFSSFVLAYSIQTKYPTPLFEAEMAIAYIKDNADKYNIDVTKVCAIGFSAGGHLAGMLATAKDDETVLGRTSAYLKPAAAILSYPVVTLGTATHGVTRDVITGGDVSMRDRLSVENRVDGNSVPVYIWHTYDDDCVPVENALMLASAYRKQGIPFGMTIFEKGWHGLSISNDEVCEFSDNQRHLYAVGKWVDLACDWLYSRGISRYKM